VDAPRRRYQNNSGPEWKDLGSIKTRPIRAEQRDGGECRIHLLDHLIGDSKNAGWDGDAERLSGFEIDRQVEFGRLR
jgi:hypothetical protein